MMSSKHESDDLNLKAQHERVRNSTEGGRCLVPYRPYARQSCSYRWQAYRQALAEPQVYNGDKYKSLQNRKGKEKLTLIRRRNAGKGEKRWEKAEVDAPKPDDWDVSEDSNNFQKSCNRPYWFEAHHIIPYSELKGAISRVGNEHPKSDALKLLVRRGLMKEGYNLNHKKNMIILPMDPLVAKALRLPKHLATPAHQDHPQYRAHVEKKVKKFFSPIKKTVSQHKEKIEYRPVKKKLEDLSTRLRKKIKDTGKTLWQTNDDVSLENVAPTPKQKGSFSLVLS